MQVELLIQSTNTISGPTLTQNTLGAEFLLDECQDLKTVLQYKLVLIRSVQLSAIFLQLSSAQFSSAESKSRSRPLEALFAVNATAEVLLWWVMDHVLPQFGPVHLRATALVGAADV